MTMLLDLLPLVTSLLVGMFATHSKEKAKDEALRTEMLIGRAKASDDSADAAAERTSEGSSWSRKFIVQSVIGSLFLFPMTLTVMNFFAPWLGLDVVSISIPRELIEGRGLFDFVFGGGGDRIVEYIPIYGFVLMPIHILIAQSIVGFYFGSSVMRRG